MNSDSEDDQNQTQSRVAASIRYCEGLDDTVVQKMVNDFVRLALFSEQKRSTMTRDDISKLVFQNHKQAFPAVFQKAQTTLRDTFGLEMVQLTTRERRKQGNNNSSTVIKKSNSYILKSILDPNERAVAVEWSEMETEGMQLLIIILSIIYAHGRCIMHDSLSTMMKRVDVDINTKVMSDLIGVFIKQGYLDKFKEKNDEEYTFVWGPRSKILFPESLMIEFMLSMYPDADQEKLDQLKRSIQLSSQGI